MAGGGQARRLEVQLHRTHSMLLQVHPLCRIRVGSKNEGLIKALL